MKRVFNYSRNGVEFVTVSAWVATRRADGFKTTVVGRLINGKLVRK